MILEDLKTLLKTGEKVVCPDCKKGNIVPAFVKGKIENYDNIHYFKCTNCDCVIETIPPIIID